MSTPRVSVLMPVYNTGRYVRQAVESVLKQSFTDLELVIVDDGSTDDSMAVLEPLSHTDARIRLSTRENRGLIDTRNELVALAKGDVVVWLDSDDLAPIDRVRDQYTRMSEQPDLVCLGGAVLLIDPEGLPLALDVSPTGREAAWEAAREGLGLRFGATAMRRACIVDVGAFRHPFKMGEDLDLVLRMSEHGAVDNLSEVTLHYRQHLHGTSLVSAATWEAYRNLVNELALERQTRGSDRLQRGEPIGVQLPDPAIARSRPTELEVRLHWARRALVRGYRQAAWKHSLAATRLQPSSAAAWRLLGRCVIGLPPRD